MKKLVKAEILWTRKCPLKCSYCAMIDYDYPRAVIGLMVEGIHKLKALGCEFFAIYGSSPLYDFGDLPIFVHEAEMMGILTTVIADGVSKDSLEKMKQLYDHGLRSLTVSWDGSDDFPDKWVKMKAEKGHKLLYQFRKECPDLRDVEVVTTLTKRNYEEVLRAIPAFTRDGIWFSFDVVHPDRGHSGTKTKGDAAGLVFEATPEDEVLLASIARKMLRLKDAGALIHQSMEYLETLATMPSMVTHFAWKCNSSVFPSWVTIDADGTVLPCDDFHTDRTFKVWEFDEDAFERFRDIYSDEVQQHCNGCIWSTHFDANRIKLSEFEGLADYKHERPSCELPI